MLSDILSRACELLGEDPAQAQDGLLGDLCVATHDALALRLRAGVSPVDCWDNFSLAAALLAADAMQAIRRGGVSKFDAGTLALNFEGSPLTVLAGQLMGPWLSGGLYFRSVAT